MSKPCFPCTLSRFGTPAINSLNGSDTLRRVRLGEGITVIIIGGSMNRFLKDRFGLIDLELGLKI